MGTDFFLNYPVTKIFFSYGGHYYLIGFGLIIFLSLILSKFSAPLKAVRGRWSEILFDGRAKPALFLFLFSFGLYGAISMLVAPPYPKSHDEFCYLLLADTFAHGRLSQPSHPLREHFETFHVNQEPTYNSKYPPAQGAALAFGQITTGLPIVGVWASSALAVVCVYWFLLALFPEKWAFYGGLLAAVHPIVFNWSQSFWGGAIAFAGGALVLGGLFRLLNDKFGFSSGVLWGVGIALLSNSRPYEGFLLAVVSGLAAIYYTIRKRDDFKNILLKICLPIALLMIVNFSWIAFYNQRTTGDIFKMPYMIHHAKYHTFPLFFFQKLKPPREIPFTDVQEYEEMSIRDYESQVSSPGAFIKSLLERVVIITGIYYTTAVGYFVPFLFGLWVARKEWIWRVLLACFGAYLAGLMLTTYSLAHYTAPGLALGIALTLKGIEYLWRSKYGTNFLKVLILLVPLANLLGILMISAKLGSSIEEDLGYQRAALVRQLTAGGEKNVVVVEKGSERMLDTRFLIYNDADIDASPVVWARDLGEAENAKLLAYYKNRDIWLLRNVDDKPELKLLRKAEK